MDFQCWSMFVDIILQNGVDVRDAYVGVKCLVCYVPGRICYSTEEFWLVSLYYWYIWFAGAAPKRDAVCPWVLAPFYILVVCFLVREVSFYRLASLSPLFWDQVVSFFWWCSLHVNLLSRCSPRYFTVEPWGMVVWLMLIDGHCPLWLVNVICVDLFWLTFIRHFCSHFSMPVRWSCRRSSM